jgi:hypothetical protein
VTTPTLSYENFLDSAAALLRKAEGYWHDAHFVSQKDDQGRNCVLVYVLDSDILNWASEPNSNTGYTRTFEQNKDLESRIANGLIAAIFSKNAKYNARLGALKSCLLTSLPSHLFEIAAYRNSLVKAFNDGQSGKFAQINSVSLSDQNLNTTRLDRDQQYLDFSESQAQRQISKSAHALVRLDNLLSQTRYQNIDTVALSLLNQHGGIFNGAIRSAFKINQERYEKWFSIFSELRPERGARGINVRDAEALSVVSSFFSADNTDQVTTTPKIRLCLITGSEVVLKAAKMAESKPFENTSLVDPQFAELCVRHPQAFLASQTYFDRSIDGREFELIDWLNLFFTKAVISDYKNFGDQEPNQRHLLNIAVLKRLLATAKQAQLISSEFIQSQLRTWFEVNVDSNVRDELSETHRLQALLSKVALEQRSSLYQIPPLILAFAGIDRKTIKRAPWVHFHNTVEGARYLHFFLDQLNKKPVPSDAVGFLASLDAFHLTLKKIAQTRADYVYHLIHALIYCSIGEFRAAATLCETAIQSISRIADNDQTTDFKVTGREAYFVLCVCLRRLSDSIEEIELARGYLKMAIEVDELRDNYDVAFNTLGFETARACDYRFTSEYISLDSRKHLMITLEIDSADRSANEFRITLSAALNFLDKLLKSESKVDESFSLKELDKSLRSGSDNRCFSWLLGQTVVSILNLSFSGLLQGYSKDQNDECTAALRKVQHLAFEKQYAKVFALESSVELVMVSLARAWLSNDPSLIMDLKVPDDSSPRVERERFRRIKHQINLRHSNAHND